MKLNMKESLQVELIDSILANAATKYSQSPYTSNCGKILRVIVSLIPTHIIVKMFAHKLSK